MHQFIHQHKIKKTVPEL